MIPAVAFLRARQTFGSVGYHQIHRLEDIKRFINAGIEYSVLTSSGFKHITLLEPQGKEQAYNLRVSILGKQYHIVAVESQLFWDFNNCKKVGLLQLGQGSGILYNTSADLRCSGMNIKLQVAEVVRIDPLDTEIDVFKMELQTQDPKVYIDSLESALH